MIAGSRILVEDGITLYGTILLCLAANFMLMLLGIMDETGILEENQVFCTFSSEEKESMVLTGSVVVTRAMSNVLMP